jgi:hypothetical protein
MSNSRILKSFLPALYPVALLLALSPFAEMFGAAGEMRPELATWRFGVVGLGLNALVAHALGLAIALAVAVYLEHRRTLRFVSAITIVAALLVVTGMVRFLLDYGQIQQLVPAAERAALDASALRALIIASLAVPVLVVLGGRGWSASGSDAADADEMDTRAPRVIPFPGRMRAPDPRWPR